MVDRKQTKREAKKHAPARAFRLSGALALGLLALLVVVFFHEVVFGGKTLVSPDTSAPAGFARVGGQSLFQERVYPLWNPYVFLGMPSFASGTYNPLIYPPDWPLGLLQKALPFLPELTWMLIYYVLGGFFMFLLAREWGARPEGALLGAAAFVFAPNLVAVGTHGHGSQLVDSAYIPLLLWLTSRWMRTGGVAHLGWLALAGGFQLLRGHVQICFYTWLAVALYVVVEWIAGLIRREPIGARTLRAVGVALAAALAFGIAGFYNLPLRDYAQHSIRGGSEGGAGMEFATQWSLAPYELPSIVVPGWTGFGGQTYWGGMPFTDYPNAYVGIVTMLLLLPAFLRNGSVRVFALLLGVFAVLISFGKYFPFYGWLYDHLPLFNKFRIPVMVIVLFQVATALGLAWGWSTVLERGAAKAEGDKRLDRLLLGAAALLAVAVVIGVAGKDVWRGSYIAFATAQKSAHGQAFPTEAATFASAQFVVDLFRAGVIGLLALGGAWLAQRRKLPPGLATTLVLILLLVELWPVSGRVMRPVLGDPVRRDLEQGKDDVIEFLEKAGPPGTFRILPVQEFQSNRFAGFAISSVGGYHAAKTRLYQDYFEADLVDNLGWMRLLNVRYIVTPQQIDPPPYLRLAHSGSAFVYENLLALPRATVVGGYRVVTPARAILDSVKNGTSESAEVTFLERDPGLRLGPVEGARTRDRLVPPERSSGGCRNARSGAAPARRSLVSGLDRHGGRPPRADSQGRLLAARRPGAGRPPPRRVPFPVAGATARAHALGRRASLVVLALLAVPLFTRLERAAKRARRRPEGPPSGEARHHSRPTTSARTSSSCSPGCSRLPYDLHVLVVDDTSPDGTGGLRPRRSRHRDPRIHLLEPRRQARARLGLSRGVSLRARARGPVHLRDGRRLLARSRLDRRPSSRPSKEVDVVLGSRYLNGVTVVNWPLQRLILSYSANRYTRLVTGMPVKDATGGYKCFRRRALEAIRPRQGEVRRLRLPDRDVLQVLAEGIHAARDPDPVRRPPRRCLQDEPPDHLGGRLDGVEAQVPGSDRNVGVTPMRWGWIGSAALAALGFLAVPPPATRGRRAVDHPAAPAHLHRPDRRRRYGLVRHARGRPGAVLARSGTFVSRTREPGGLASNRLTSLAMDRSRRLWIGTRGGGASFLRADRSTWGLVNAFDGLQSDTVTVLEANGDTIWIGTTRGIALWNGREIAGAFPDGVNPSPFAKQQRHRNRRVRERALGRDSERRLSQHGRERPRHLDRGEHRLADPHGRGARLRRNDAVRARRPARSPARYRDRPMERGRQSRHRLSTRRRPGPGDRGQRLGASISGSGGTGA